MQDLHEADVVFNRRAILKAEDNRGLALGLGPFHIRRRAAMQYVIGILAEVLIPGDHILHGLREIFMVGDGDMRRGNPARPHLAEHLRGPVVILQCVDDQGGRVHVVWILLFV